LGSQCAFLRVACAPSFRATFLARLAAHQAAGTRGWSYLGAAVGTGRLVRRRAGNPRPVTPKTLTSIRTGRLPQIWAQPRAAPVAATNLSQGLPRRGHQTGPPSLVTIWQEAGIGVCGGGRRVPMLGNISPKNAELPTRLQHLTWYVPGKAWHDLAKAASMTQKSYCEAFKDPYV